MQLSGGRVAPGKREARARIAHAEARDCRGSALALGAVASVPATARATITVGSDPAWRPPQSSPAPRPSAAPLGGWRRGVRRGRRPCRQRHPAKSPANGTVVAGGSGLGVSCGPVMGPLASETVTSDWSEPSRRPTARSASPRDRPSRQIRIRSRSPPPARSSTGRVLLPPARGPAIHAGDYVGIDTSATWAVPASAAAATPKFSMPTSRRSLTVGRLRAKPASLTVSCWSTPWSSRAARSSSEARRDRSRGSTSSTVQVPARVRSPSGQGVAGRPAGTASLGSARP